MSQEGKEKIKELKERIFKHKNAVSFYMERVPSKTVDVFKQFANDEFVGDYGLAFKRIVDMVLVDPLPFQEIFAILNEHSERLINLETKGEEKPKKRKMVTPIKELGKRRRGE